MEIQLMEIINPVAETLGPDGNTEQLELSLGLTDAQRRRLNANAIMQILDDGKLVSVETANPKLCGTETATIVQRRRKSLGEPR